MWLAFRRTALSLGLTLLGLTIAFVIMRHDMPHVYPGLSEIRAFLWEKAERDQGPELTDLQRLRERNSTLPQTPQGLAAPIGGGSVYGILDVFRMKEVFPPNDEPTLPLRTRPAQGDMPPKLPFVGETRKSNNSLLGTL